MATPRIQGIRRSRSRAGVVLLALALLCGAPALADQDLGPVTLSGDVTLGGRLVWGQDNRAKFQEYRDLRDGVIGSFDLLLEDSEVEHFLRARSENTGYNDQRYWLEGGRYGLYKFDLFYGELPYFQSNVSQTPYVRTGPNDWTLPVSLADRDLLEAQAGVGMIDPALLPFQPKNIKLKWTEGRVGGEYHLGESTLLRTSYRIQDKQGNKPWALAFGNPGPAGHFTTLPSRVDELDHEVTVGTDWHRDNTSFTVEYLGNFYDNNLHKALLADNPIVAPDTATTLPDQGQAALPPDNWSQSLLLSGSTQLPIGIPNQIGASFAYGFRYQNEDFLPNTINPRIADPALPKNSLDGQVQTLLGNLVATLRPAPDLGVRLRYRAYDYDNLTDSITFPATVENDTTVQTGPFTTLRNDYLRQDANLDVDWEFAPSWTGGLGFDFEGWNRSADREVRDLYEYGPNLNLDYRTMNGTLAHLGYTFLARDGSHYNAFAPVETSDGIDCAVIPTPTECTTLKLAQIRKFDEANRFLHRLDLKETITPIEDLELGFNSDFGYSDYADSKFGLTEALDWSVGPDVFYQIHPRIALTAYYTYQWQQYNQRSRNRPVTGGVPVDDPANDWNSRTRYEYHNAEATARFAVVPDKVDLELGYLVQAGKEKTNASGDGAVNYPAVDDLLQAVSATVSWNFREDVKLSAGYRFEDYNVNNFRDKLVPSSLVDPSNDIYLGNAVKGYQANVFVMSATVSF